MLEGRRSEVVSTLSLHPLATSRRATTARLFAPSARHGDLAAMCRTTTACVPKAPDSGAIVTRLRQQTRFVFGA